MTRAGQNESSTLGIVKWLDADKLLPYQYAVVRVGNADGSFFHAIALPQGAMQSLEEWNVTKMRFDLCCMISLLPPEQIDILGQTVRQYFAASTEGQQIAANHSHLPCFSDLANGQQAPDTSQMGLLVEPNDVLQKEAFPLPASIAKALDDLNTSETPPDPEALTLARSWVSSLYSEIKSQEAPWITPHLTVQDGGDVVFEWWHGQKSLGVYVSVGEVWFLQSAGSNSEQHEGEANTPEVRLSIWQWLTQ